MAFGFAIAACVIAAIASVLTGRRPSAPGVPDPLGYELASVAAEGGFEPSELVVPDVPGDGAELPGKPPEPD